MNAPVSLPAVALRDLSKSVYSNGWTLWHYRADRIDDVLAPPFWADATMLKRGDHIAVSAEDGGATLYVGRCGVVVMAAVVMAAVDE